jgi:hypothetical protein
MLEEDIDLNSDSLDSNLSITFTQKSSSTLSKLLNLPVPQFTHLGKESDDRRSSWQSHRMAMRIDYVYVHTDCNILCNSTFKVLLHIFTYITHTHTCVNYNISVFLAVSCQKKGLCSKLGVFKSRDCVSFILKTLLTYINKASCFSLYFLSRIHWRDLKLTVGIT